MNATLQKINSKMPWAVIKEKNNIIAELQHTVTAIQINLAQISLTQSYTGNPYKDYDFAITELSRKYEGIADWGNQQVRNIVDVRSAFIIGQGLKVVERDSKTKKNKRIGQETSREMDFIEEFIQHNDLDEEGAQEFAKEAEIEGRVLFRLVPNEEKKQIDLRHVSYSEHKYTVHSDGDNAKKYTRVTYKINGQEIVLKEGEFIYKRFAGRANMVNKIKPKVAMVLRQIEDLDKALWDLRKINNLFASPTPHFKVENAEQAKSLHEALKETNWKIGKFLVTNSEFSLVSADISGAESLIKEIIKLAQMISAATGIPVHFLGFPELMSNRSVSADLFEMIIASTTKERSVWIGCWEEVFLRVLEMASSGLGVGFNFKTETVGCEIPQVTEKKLKELVEVWLPLFNSGVVDIDFFLAKVPDADPEKIKKSQEEKAKKDFEMMKASIGGK